MGKLIVLCISVLLGSVIADSDLDLWNAAKNGDINMVYDAISRGADVEWVNPEGNWDKWTALHYASYNNDISIVGILLDSGAYVNKDTHSGSNPLVLASGAGNVETVNLLISQGAAVNWQGIGFTALHAAAAGNHLRVMNILFEAGANPNLESNGRTPLYIAAEKGNADVVNSLIAQGADLNMQTWNGDKTALMIAIEEGYPYIAEALIFANADLELVSEYGLTALHFAAKYNQPDIAQFLLVRGANPNQQDDDGKTPRDIAVDQGITQYLDSFSVLGSQPQPVEAHVRDIEKETPEGEFTSDYSAAFMMGGGVIISMATSLFFVFN